MKTNKNALIKKYVRDIKTLLPIHGKKEREYLHKMAENLEYFPEEHESNSMEEVYGELGNPIDILHQYYSQLNTSELVKMIRLKQLLTNVIRFACLLLLTAFVFSSVLLYQEHQLLLREEAVSITITTTQNEGVTQ